MDKAGFGGKVVKLFASFYEEDNVRIEVGNKLTRKMFLKNGLKQERSKIHINRPIS